MLKEKLSLDFVLFDMIGTTVQDAGSGKSVILESFKNAFSKHGIEVEYGIINEQRGKSKLIAIQNILGNLSLELNDLPVLIYDEFMNSLESTIINFQEMPQASHVFKTLKSKDIKIGIGSGLPLQFINQLLEHLPWDSNDFDYINSSDELSAGRPDPTMIHDVIDLLKLEDRNRILKIGDTVVDVMEAKNAKVLAAMVLSGTQTRENLGETIPDFIWGSITDLLEFI